ncbi:TolC family protein [Kordia sp. YSTF-M3]|uniref:TolC family protein n=1 Tax=Kordia aestuariivivens TaxID=2759037 RepID=A0ABR7QBH7_9FLAO|nr:TolC family protein [Kordia aestuariivivens]MBC8755868.1 TolC family protein [Kordia aestuariivivens]
MKHIVFILFCTFPILAISQSDTLFITKEEVLSKIASNNTIKISEQEVLVARGDFNQTNAIFLPKITASHNAISTTNPLMAFGSKLNQEILTASDFNPAFLNNPSRIDNYSTKIEIVQPILNLDGIYQRKAAKQIVSALELQSENATNKISLEVEKTYMQLQLAYKMISVLELTKKTVDENKRLVKNLYKQGMVQKTDILEMDIRSTEIENQLQYAKSIILNTSNYLSVLLNENIAKLIKPLDSLQINPMKEFPGFIPKSRADILAMDFSIKAYTAMNKADKMSFLPRLNAFGSYQLYDNSLFQGNANGYIIGVDLSWDILDGYKRFGKTQKSKALLEKAKIQYDEYITQSQLELNKVIRHFQDIKNKLVLTDLAVIQSKEALRIRTNRFKQGLEKTNDLLASESLYAQKQLEYYQTVFEYNFAQAYIQYLTKEE